MRRLMALARIPKSHWDVTLDEIEPELGYGGRIRHYVGRLDVAISESCGLFLYGPPSSGKTSAGVIVLMEALKACRTAFFVKGSELPKHIYESVPFADGYTTKTMLRFADVLMIDDFDVDMKNSRAVVECTNDLVRFRMQRECVTIMTANYSPADVERECGKTLSEALKVHTVSVDVSGKNWRDEERQSKLETVFGRSEAT